jgi:hypothetical protein
LPRFPEEEAILVSGKSISSHESIMVSLPEHPINTWRDVFCHWPAEMPRRGVLVAAFGEQIPFSSFSSIEAFLLVERQSPDAMGARMILLPYDKILGLKIVDVLKPRALQSFGFEPPAPKQDAHAARTGEA